MKKAQASNLIFCYSLLMANQAISAAVNELKQEHIRLVKELARVDEALSALGGLNGVGAAPAAKRGRKPGVAVKSAAKTEGRRKISPAARKKMSEAARARWAARRKDAGKEKAPAKQ